MFRSVLRMFQGCFRGVLGMLYGCVRDVLGMFLDICPAYFVSLLVSRLDICLMFFDTSYF